jgi:hypothetical protein
MQRKMMRGCGLRPECSAGHKDARGGKKLLISNDKVVCIDLLKRIEVILRLRDMQYGSGAICG